MSYYSSEGAGCNRKCELIPSNTSLQPEGEARGRSPRAAVMYYEGWVSIFDYIPSPKSCNNITMLWLKWTTAGKVFYSHSFFLFNLFNTVSKLESITHPRASIENDCVVSRTFLNHIVIKFVKWKCSLLALGWVMANTRPRASIGQYIPHFKNMTKNSWNSGMYWKM